MEDREAEDLVDLQVAKRAEVDGRPFLDEGAEFGQGGRPTLEEAERAKEDRRYVALRAIFALAVRGGNSSVRATAASMLSGRNEGDNHCLGDAELQVGEERVFV